MLDVIRKRKRYEYIKWYEKKTVEGYDDKSNPYYSSTYEVLFNSPEGQVVIDLTEQDLMSLASLLKEVL